MSDAHALRADAPSGGSSLFSRISILLMFLGLYLTLRGYHSFDGDQAYRLPLLFHQQNAHVYADDPFVRAFDTFNPHRGSLLILDLLSRPLGLPAAIFVLFLLSFWATCWGIDRLARAVWPRLHPSVGLVAVGLVLTAKAGNIGTNHLFEAMVLDRLQAFALGWLAIADAVTDPGRRKIRPAITIALATLIHPSVGLQLALFLAACWLAWGFLGRSTEVHWRTAGWALAGLLIAVLPGLAFNLGSGVSLQGTMPADTFWLLSVELQSPQHMLPHLWRMPQWLAWSSYLMLGAIAVLALSRWSPTSSFKRVEQGGWNHWPPARLRLTVALGVLLVGLASAWAGIELWHHVRITVFQPFRMATVARGMAIVLTSGRLTHLWITGGWLGRLRAVVLATAFISDWLLVMVTLAELSVTAMTALRTRFDSMNIRVWLDTLVYFAALAYGLNFLGHHDTEYGHIPLAASLCIGLIAGLVNNPSFPHVRVTRRRWATACLLVWIVPLLSLVAASLPSENRLARHPIVQGLLNRCRFTPTPADDIERLALWCRDHTPETARFIGPPGPKTFRLWSRRSVAFNRAASPYHADALADWFARFQDHVDYHGPAAEFVHAYISDRHGFEARYQQMTDAERAELAIRQSASYVIAAAPRDPVAADSDSASSPLNLLRVEGRYAVYQVNPQRLAHRH